MTVFILLDERGGVAFGKRRQSRDRALTRDLVRYAGGRRIVIGEYSRLLFDEAEIGLSENNITVVPDPTSAASAGDFVLLELFADKDFLLSASELVIYCWNRHYPSSVKLDRAFFEANFKLVSECEFVGNSHEKLTRYTTKRK